MFSDQADMKGKMIFKGSSPGVQKFKNPWGYSWRLNLFVLFFLFVAPLCVLNAQEEGDNFLSTASLARMTSASDAISVTPAGEGRISLDLKGVDIVELLKILSMKMDKNIVPTKEVMGRVSVFLNNVTFEDALDIILINNGLAAVKEKNITTVMPLKVYAEMYGQRYKETRKVRVFELKTASPKDVERALKQLKSDIGKVIVDEASGTVILVDVPSSLELMEKTLMTLDSPKNAEIFSLKYAKAQDVKKQLGKVFTPGASQVEVDARTNKMAVSDLPDKMKNIKKMIEAFDVEPKEVLIETQIVQVEYKGQFPVVGLTDQGAVSVGTLSGSEFGSVMQELNRLAKTNVLSRPRIVVVSGEEGDILIGSREAYFSQTQTLSSGTTVTAEAINYMDVGIKLNVKPTVIEDGYVLMRIRPEVSSIQGYAVSPLGSKIPLLLTSRADTTVKVKNNAIVMIAGFMKDEGQKKKQPTPFWGHIPFLGKLFNQGVVDKKKTELAIFLTPHIVTGDAEKVDAEREQVKVRGVLTKQIKEKIE